MCAYAREDLECSLSSLSRSLSPFLSGHISIIIFMVEQYDNGSSTLVYFVHIYTPTYKGDVIHTHTHIHRTVRVNYFVHAWPPPPDP